ncbi:DUF4868 domain-containing protein [Paenibacillus dendritiformis]|uniref:DUF4868 domain-containing protein n=1 Tax=Paenibacillus dendritiformis TaxID=130049 RepID=UPI00366664E5
MPRERTVESINRIFQNEEYGFEAFIVMKNDVLKRLILFEGSPIKSDNHENFKEAIRADISEYINREYLSPEAEYELAEKIADNQHKYYVIEQTDAYRPFHMLNTSIDSLDTFSMDDRAEAKGLLFMFKRDETKIWGYQHIYAVTVPNKSKKGWLSIQQGDVFKEMPLPLFPIAKKVHLLIIEHEIVTKDISLMQRSFGFETFIRNSALTVIEKVSKIDLVDNLEKLSLYAERSQLTYAKKMMRIKNSAVLRLSAELLLERIQTLPRWSGKFILSNDKIVLNTFGHVENLIDLLDEKYTRSDVTGEEYSTDVKQLAPPI